MEALCLMNNFNYDVLHGNQVDVVFFKNHVLHNLNFKIGFEIVITSSYTLSILFPSNF